jgi:hypothetical protein
MGFRMPEDPDFLQARLEHARRRVDDASPYSPDWDAATEAVDDLMRRLIRALGEQTTRV